MDTKKIMNMSETEQREWYAKEINKVEKYLDWLKKESGKLARAGFGKIKVDRERPDLIHLTNE